MRRSGEATGRPLAAAAAAADRDGVPLRHVACALAAALAVAASPAGAPPAVPGASDAAPARATLAAHVAGAADTPVAALSTRATLAHWTRARMLAARPADAVGPGTRRSRPSGLDAYLHRLAPRSGGSPATSTGARWTGGGQVVRTTGKVFFSLGADDYVCSGSAVDAPDRSTVLTAGHCVDDPETGTQATNWLFVPGYTDGHAPYGLFAATHLATTQGWRTAQDFDVDVAFADVAPNAAGVRLEDAVGAQPIAFDEPRGGTAAAFGYPAAAPWTGERLVSCSGALHADPTPQPSTDQGMTCTMTGGSSGGPWLGGFDRRTGTGRVVSLTSFSYSNAPGVLYGPYLGDVAKALYASVASTPGV